MHGLLLTAEGIFSSITSDMLMGVFNSVIEVLPTVVPVTVAFAGFHKAWGFIKGAIFG